MGSPSLKQSPPNIKESSNDYLSPFSTFFVNYFSGSHLQSVFGLRLPFVSVPPFLT